MLHLVESYAGLLKCKHFVKRGDDVVFLGDGATHAQTIHNCNVLVHQQDVVRCDVVLPADVIPCTTDKIVELVANHDQSATWS